MTTIQQVFEYNADFFLADESTIFAKDLIQTSATNDYKKNILSGSCSSTKSAFMEEVAAKFTFPSYFGKNWDALLDSLNETLWCLPGCSQYMLVFTEADSLLSQEADIEISNLFEILKASIDALSGSDRNLQLKVVFLLKQVRDSRLEKAMADQGLRYQMLVAA